MQVQNNIKLEELELFPIDRSMKLVKLGTTSDPVNPVIVIKNMQVKYLPEKYSKITTILPDDALEQLRVFQDQLKKDMQVEEFIKDSSISLKIDNQVKEQTKTLSKGDYISVAIKFGDVWTMNKKKYVSWQLIQFKKVDAPVSTIYNL